MRLSMCRRLLMLSAGFLLILASLGGRVYHLQVVKEAEYARIAHGQRLLSLPVSSQRGAILDRNGEPLSDPQPGWGIALFPPLLADKKGISDRLGPILGYSPETLLARLNREVKPFWLESAVSLSVAGKVQELQLPGVVAAPVGTRYGPGSMARHLIGYVNSQGGQMGVERAFEQALVGEAIPSLVAYLDGKGRPIAGLGVRAMLPVRGKQPYQIHTTIDSRIQRAVELVLDNHRAADGSRLRAAAVVLDSSTGEVLATASRPQFEYGDLPVLLGEPNESGGPLINRPVAPYPPGSVFKAIVAAIALEEGHTNMEELFYCPGDYVIGGHRFIDSAGAHGWITFGQALAQSCNVTFLKLVNERIGADHLLQAAARFGFGEATNAFGLASPWPEENAGNLPSLQDPGLIQLAFGQGALEATPLQVARAFAAIANGGILPPAALTTAVKSAAGEVVYRPERTKGVRVISRETALRLQEGLAAVTEPDGRGTGRQAWIAGIGSAGKTGSAEGQNSEGEEVVHAWFAGYFPLRTPQYVVVIMVEGGGAGGSAAAPIFREIGQAILAVTGM